MTDTVFYDEMAKLATELMNEFGTPATLRKVTKGKPGADGKAVVTFADTPGLAVRVHDMEVIRALNLEGDVGYATKFPVQGEDGDQLIHGGTTLELVSSKYVNPEGNRLMVAFHGVKLA